MRSVAHFAPFWETPQSAGVSQKGIKRGLGNDGLDVAEDQELDFRPDSASSASLQRTDPYFVSGHARTAPEPPLSFPHRAVHDRGQRSRTASIDSELASLNPPLYTSPAGDGDSSSLQSQHAAVMGSILHVSLLRGDYVRAGQAFGLLLRVTGGSHGLALRNNGNWGIGAEILLQKAIASRRRTERPTSIRQDDPDSDLDSIHSSHSLNDANSLHSSSDNPIDLSAAKDYYEKLILQFPYRKQAPANAIDARTFYPALFGVLIYEATALAGDNPDPTAAKQAELRAARPIASRMDELLQSSPYDRFAPLLRQRGMVGLWIADLVTALLQAGDEDEDEDDDQTARDDARRLAANERDTARWCFERCMRGGGHVPDEVLRITR